MKKLNWAALISYVVIVIIAGLLFVSLIKSIL